MSLAGNSAIRIKKDQVSIVLRSVLHTLRDRITIQESLHFLAQLPLFLKAIYVDQWKYREQPLSMRTIEAFKEEVKSVSCSTESGF